MAEKYPSTASPDISFEFSSVTSLANVPFTFNISSTAQEIPCLDAGNSATAPPVNMPKLKFFIIFIYSFLSLGIFFNVRVIYIVIRILITHNPSLRYDGNRHAFIYVLSLSIVDALVLSHLPLVATDIVLSSWVFGDAVCKLYWLIEQVNRILSTFILTALSADRYLAICFPLQSVRWRTTWVALGVITLCIFVAICLLSPTLVYSHVVEWEVSNHTISKCMFAMDQVTLGRFLTYVFICGYCVPLFSMIFFYGSILRTLWHGQPAPVLRLSSSTSERFENGNGTVTVWTNGGRRRRERAQHVTQRALVLVTFYFACWTPYWLVQFALHWRWFAISDDVTRAEDGVIIAIYAVHVLVYVNSAVNPFLYALLNKELQRQRSFLHKHRGRRGAICENGDFSTLERRFERSGTGVMMCSSYIMNGSNADIFKRPSAYETTNFDNNIRHCKSGC